MAWTVFETTIGPCGIAWTNEGVLAFQLPEATADETASRLMAKCPSAGETAKPPKAIAAAIKSVQKHLSGTPQSFDDVPIDFSAAKGFRAEVYRALRKVPPGETVTYGELAGLAGSPGAARAVGSAMATNPFPILVACHRVFAAGGKPGGFTAYGGLVTKKKILELEGWVDKAKKRASESKATSAPNPTKSGFQFDPKAAVEHLSTCDPILAAHVKSVPFAYAMKDTDGIFGALAEAIVYQQLHGKAAATIFGRVKALFPKGKLDPKRLLALDEADLRKAGLSNNKYRALKDLAERADRGEIPTLAKLAKMDDEAIVQALTKVRGIGRWTVEMMLMFRLGRPDVFPVDDIGIRKGFARLYHSKKKRDEEPDLTKMKTRAELWRPYRSIASWYLWRAAELRDDPS